MTVQREETTQSIAMWASETFGPATNLAVAIRANEEMAELLRALSVDDFNPNAKAEIADIVIVLSRLIYSLNMSCQEEVDKKMAINRQRRWVKNGDGTGRHVRETTARTDSESPQ